MAYTLKQRHKSILLCLLLLLPSLLLFTKAANETSKFETITLQNPFNNSFGEKLKFLGEAKLDNKALQITEDTQNEDSYLVNNSGRVIYDRAFKIWEDSTNQSGKKIITFSSIFDFNIYPLRNKTAGEGLAFVIVPNADEPPGDSHGQYLGLTNSMTDGDQVNKLIAVEFDTLKQSFDRDDNHVGLNINGVRSVAAASLSKFNITLAPLQEKGIQYRCWINYDGQKRYIKVYLSLIDSPKPAVPVLSAAVDISAYLAQRSYFGFSASTGLNFQLNCVLAWNLTIEILPEKKIIKPIIWFLWIGVPIFAVIIISVIVLGIWLKRKKEKRDEIIVDKLKYLPGTPREFSYRLLKKATGNFHVKNILGRGGYGVVYKGIIPKENTVVAVKTFSRETMQGDFLSELTIINRLRHRNLVGLIGWCYKNGKLLLVYEFMPNGSLDRYLFDAHQGQHLTWQQRHSILTDVASALHYLQNEYNQRVVHRDLKASNVLLDGNFNAKLGDFGLARAIDNERTSYADILVDGVPGTLGYVAPECFHTGKATRESDIFSFGAVILEVVCGQRPRCDIGRYHFLADWVWSLYRDGRILSAVDKRLKKEYDRGQAERLLLLGLACSQPSPTERPDVYTVVQAISGNGPVPEVPMVRPAFVWPSACEELNQDCAMTTGTCTRTESSSNPLLYVYTGQSQFCDITAR